jgi:hypothetical protein
MSLYLEGALGGVEQKGAIGLPSEDGPLDEAVLDAKRPLLPEAGGESCFYLRGRSLLPVEILGFKGV